jgi:hypothetical protein
MNSTSNFFAHHPRGGNCPDCPPPGYATGVVRKYNSFLGEIMHANTLRLINECYVVLGKLRQKYFMRTSIDGLFHGCDARRGCKFISWWLVWTIAALLRSVYRPQTLALGPRQSMCAGTVSHRNVYQRSTMANRLRPRWRWVSCGKPTFNGVRWVRTSQQTRKNYADNLCMWMTMYSRTVCSEFVNKTFMFLFRSQV